MKRVLTLSPLPPEKCAYALARYSRSPDSLRDSIEWVRTHDSAKFLESFYFQYGHASIADLGHVVIGLEGISELAATEVEDEQLWDGQARSSRYQDFSRAGFITPPEFDEAQTAAYSEAATQLLDGYRRVHAGMVEFLSEKLPRPESMKPEAYNRNIAARAFDVARYLLPFGIPTGIGQVTSIRTLERQIGRLKASEYGELRGLADEIAVACAAPPDCVWDPAAAVEPVAPTLARHVGPNAHFQQSRIDLRLWAEQNLPAWTRADTPDVDLLHPREAAADIAATLLYPVVDRPFRALYEWAVAGGAATRREVMDAALGSRDAHADLLRGFRAAPYAYDIVMDIGAYRDFHRHRRCQQFRQDYGTALGFDTPEQIGAAGLAAEYDDLLRKTHANARALPRPGADYLLPLATRSRFLFKMDFAEAEYICRQRSGVKGHFSYRRIAWEMKEAMARFEPELARYLQATPPWIEDPLKR